MAAAEQDDVDVYRSMANMPPGGFYVGSTTGWMVNATAPEFLRRVACDVCRRFNAAADACRMFRYRVNITQQAYYYLSVRRAPCFCKRDVAVELTRRAALCFRINIPNTPTYCNGVTSAFSVNYEVRLGGTLRFGHARKQT